MNEYHEKAGLHVVTLYAQTHKLEEIEELVNKHEIKYPIAMDAFWDAGYHAPGLPKMWIIGADGKVKFAGMSGYSKVLEEELAKVKYPGLAKDKVHSALEPAAKLFVEGKYAEAHKAAEALYDETDDETVEEDASYIMKRIEARMSALAVRAETAEAMKDYALAMKCWEQLAAYKGLDDAEEAPARLKKLQGSEDVKKELAAKRALLAEMLLLDLGYAEIDASDADQLKKFREKCLETYKKFAADNKGTGAAERANELIGIFKELLGIKD
ncbi:MAG: hypothetical protein IT464_03100 [Planctomycetes bacterium]|nr:hypothetical protein [Planctomycetota bacterium]